MNSQSTIRWTLGLAASVAVAACTAASPGLGPDARSRSDASVVTWTDGRPAYAVKCDLPGGCQERVLAICKQGPYTTLKSENMPLAGSARDLQRPPSVVVRCG
jgi:hypothetical protein